MNNSSIKHWGEIETQPRNEQIPDVSADIEKSRSKFCLAEFDDEQNNSQQLDHLILQPMNPYILHAIALHKHANDMMEKIRVAELAVEHGVQPPIDAATLIPEFEAPPRLHVRNSLNYIDKEFMSYSPGEQVNVPEISDAVAKQILIKCVAAMFAHIGFETTHQSVLDLMVDVLESILKKISCKVRIAHDDDVQPQSSDSLILLERVFVEIGLDGIKGIHDFYENRVIKYVNVLRKRCQDLILHYENLPEPSTLTDSEKMNKMFLANIKQEDEEEDNPEMHFENGDLITSTFEPAFKLLNSLEAATPNLKEEEESNAMASVGSSTAADMDYSSSSPLNKKKKCK